MDSCRRTVVLGLLLAAGLSAQELVSGPVVGAALGKALVYAPTGPRAGQEYDASTALGDGPAALLFVHEVTRNTAPMIGGFDKLALEFQALGLRTVAIRLAADRSEAEAATKRQSDALAMHYPMVVSVDGGEGPGDYALNRRCTLTLVLAKGGKVVRSVAYTDTGRQDLPKLRACFEEIAGALPDDEAALRKKLAQALPADVNVLKELVTELLVEVRRAAKERERAMNAPASRPMRAPESRKREDAAPRRDR